MGNHSARPRGFNDAPSTPNSPRIDTANNKQSSPNMAKNMNTNDFLDDMLVDIGPTNYNNSNNNGKQSKASEKKEPEYNLKKKVCAYNTNEFNSIFEQVSEEIDDSYDNINNSTSPSINSQTVNSISTKLTNHHKNNNGNNNNNQLYVEQVDNIKQIFKYRKQLGKGGTCRVILVEKRKTHKNKNKNKNKYKEKYALKELSKHDKYNEELFAKEIQLLRLLSDNINVVDYYASYQTKYYFYLATTFCEGGTFLDRILEMKVFSEKIAIKYIYTILSTISFMHNKGIVHRDLKLNNMVFDKLGDDGILKIIDFGDSDIVNDNKSYKELVGTLYYLSPECKKSRKGWEVKKSDMWALGVICYILLSGKLPFSGNTQQETFKLIEKGKFEWPKNIELSKSCKSFINGLLCKNTTKRMSADDALKHEWITDYEHKANDINILDKIKQFLKDFNYNNKLHKILVNACLEEIDEDERKVVIKAFHNIDIENKGNINEHDICRYLVVNSKINKTYGNRKGKDNDDASKHAKHIFKVIEKGTGIGSKMQKSKSIPIDDFVKDISSTPPKQIIETNSTGNNSDDDDNKFIDDDENESDDPELKPIPSNNEINHGAKNKENVNEDGDNISVSTFTNIMNKSPKKYPVAAIVKDLDPNDTGFISFQSISKFSKTIKTISYDGQSSIDEFE